MATDQAKRLAEERGLDLVEVAAKEHPPICKIMNYGQFKYQKEKQEQKMKKQQKKIEVKGIRISPRISTNDLMFKAKMADKFLQQGNKVRVEMIIRGREYAHMELVNETFSRFVKTLTTKVEIEQGKKKQRMGIAMVIAPAR